MPVGPEMKMIQGESTPHEIRFAGTSPATVPDVTGVHSAGYRIFSPIDTHRI
jgi:hypothetical protein